MRLSLSVLLLSGALSLAARAETPKTSQVLLEQLGADMAQVWADFPKDNQKAVRDAKFQDLNTAFTRDIAKADVPANYTAQKAIETFIANVAKSKTLLRLDVMQLDRATFVTACNTTLRHEITITSDFKNARTTQQCFELMIDMLVLAREKLHAYSVDTQQTGYTGVNMAVTEVLHKATVPEKPDPTTQLDLNLKEARRRFPTTTPELETANRTVIGLLESTAKVIQQMKK